MVVNRNKADTSRICTDRGACAFSLGVKLVCSCYCLIGSTAPRSCPCIGLFRALHTAGHAVIEACVLRALQHGSKR